MPKAENSTYTKKPPPNIKIFNSLSNLRGIKSNCPILQKSSHQKPCDAIMLIKKTHSTTNLCEWCNYHVFSMSVREKYINKSQIKHKNYIKEKTAVYSPNNKKRYIKWPKDQ